MEMRDMDNNVLIYLLIGACAITLVVGLIRFFIWYASASKEIRMELGRTEGAEYRYWIRELRALHLTLIPGITWHRARRIAHKGDRH